MPDAARKWLCEFEEWRESGQTDSFDDAGAKHLCRLLETNETLDGCLTSMVEHHEVETNALEADRRNLVAYVRALKVRNGYVHLPFEDMPEAWQALGESLREEIDAIR